MFHVEHIISRKELKIMALKPEDIIGKTVIVGLTFVDKYGVKLKDDDFAGQIIEISPDKGIVVANNDTMKAIGLPLNYDAFQVAEKGYYELKKSGLKIKNPDLTCTMTLTEK